MCIRQHDRNTTGWTLHTRFVQFIQEISDKHKDVQTCTACRGSAGLNLTPSSCPLPLSFIYLSFINLHLDHNWQMCSEHCNALIQIHSHEENLLRHTNTPTDEDCKEFLFMSALPRKSDATATSTGTLRQHLHSRPDLNDHSSQWENFNGAPGRKEAASLLILGTLHLRWNAGNGREEAWRGGKVLCLSLSRLSASCLFLTIITPCIRYERVS